MSKIADAIGPAIDEKFASKVLGIVDKGLSYGLGMPETGKMCVEAAVAFASGEDHNDHPTCVDESLANIKINMNDELDWKDNKDRAKGLRRVAIAQLGSAGRFDSEKFTAELNKLAGPYQLAAAKKRAIDESKGTLDDSNESLAEHKSELKRIARQIASIKKAIAKLKKAKSLKAAVLQGYKSQAALDNSSSIGVDLAQQIEQSGVNGNKACHIAAELVTKALVKLKIPGTKYLYLTKKKTKKGAKKRKV